MTTLANSYSLVGKAEPEYAQLKLLQPLSKPVLEGKSKPGKIFNTLTDEAYDSMNLIILGAREEFRVWKGKDGLSKFPEYYSDDMKTLVHLDPETGEKLGEQSLPESPQWNNRLENKNSKRQYCFLATFPEKPSPLLFRVGGLGYKYARTFLSKARNSGKQLFEFITKISVCQERTAYGTSYIADFQMTEMPMPQSWNIEKASKICQRFIDNTQALLPAPQQFDE